MTWDDTKVVVLSRAGGGPSEAILLRQSIALNLRGTIDASDC